MVFDRGAEEHKIVQTLGDGYYLAPNMKSCHVTTQNNLEDIMLSETGQSLKDKQYDSTH